MPAPPCCIYFWFGFLRILIFKNKIESYSVIIGEYINDIDIGVRLGDLSQSIFIFQNSLRKSFIGGVFLWRTLRMGICLIY